MIYSLSDSLIWDEYEISMCTTKLLQHFHFRESVDITIFAVVQISQFLDSSWNANEFCVEYFKA